MPRGELPKGVIDLGGNCPGGELSRGELVGGNCPGGIVQGGTDLEPKQICPFQAFIQHSNDIVWGKRCSIGKGYILL